MIFKQISLPSIEIVDQLTPTERGSKGFSSTDKASDQLQHPSPPIEAFNISDRHAAATATASVSTPHAFLHFSDDPFDNQITINIEKKDVTLPLDWISKCVQTESNHVSLVVAKVNQLEK